LAFEFRNLRRLGNRVDIALPKDKDGFLGRECPQAACEGYFKIKPGTGLKGSELPCHCPYCGHTDSHDRFWTKEQVEYAHSIALKQITDAMRADLKTLEFEHKSTGPFGIGISMKVQPGPPIPIRHYREKALETTVACESCTLEYSVFGVFAFRPDCREHNSLTILLRNLTLTRKQLALASTVPDEALRQHLVEDALENCVSAFDGFAREACSVRRAKSTDPSKAAFLSFQNLPRVAPRLRALFAIDLPSHVAPTDWRFGHLQFMKRHLIAHRAGVVDQQYLDETAEPRTLLGRRVSVPPSDVENLATVVERIGVTLVRVLPAP
jgi:hypothetical protein